MEWRRTRAEGLWVIDSDSGYPVRRSGGGFELYVRARNSFRSEGDNKRERRRKGLQPAQHQVTFLISIT